MPLFVTEGVRLSWDTAGVSVGESSVGGGSMASMSALFWVTVGTMEAPKFVEAIVV